jgi:hypothetical protein
MFDDKRPSALIRSAPRGGKEYFVSLVNEFLILNTIIETCSMRALSKNIKPSLKVGLYSRDIIIG